MNKNLKIYAGASILVGAIAVGGIALNSDLPTNEPKESIAMETAQADLGIAVIPVKMELENGDVGYVIPEGYSFYHVNEDIVGPEKLNLIVKDGYTVYSYNPNEYVGCSLDGYIGVKSEYMDSLRDLDYIKSEISLRNPEYTVNLTKLDHHDVITDPYFLANGYELYDLTDMYENIAFPYVKEEDGTVYGLSDEYVSNFVGVNSSTYNTIQQLESLEAEIEDAYNQEYGKTSSRS